MRPENLRACPAEAFNLVCPPLREYTSLDLNFEVHNLEPFFLSESQLLLEHSHFATSCWVSPHHQHVDTGNYCHKSTCFQTCNYDTREDADNHTTMFYILHLIDKEFQLESQVWPLDFSSVCRQSVLFPSVQKRMLALYLFAFARYQRLV